MALKTNKKLLFLFFKVLISVCLLAYVFRKAGLQNILGNLRSVDARFFLLAILLHVVIVFVAAFRWRLLLEHRYPLGRVFSLYFIGSFFNTILPGAVGGDAVKIYYLYKDSGKGGDSMGSVLLDRSVGLLGLLLVGTVAGMIAFDDLRAVKMQWVIPLLFLAYIGALAVIFGMRLGDRFKPVSELHDYIRRFTDRKKRLIAALALSLLIQVLSISMVYTIALGLDQKLSFTALFVFVPIIITLASLPISIAGFGIRESAFVVLFGLTGVTSAASMSISFLWFLSVAVASLVGLVEYARFRREKPLH